MIVEYIRYALKEHRPDTFISAYTEAARHLALAPECVDFELSQCVDDTASFVLRIRWVSADAHMKGFRTGPNFPGFLAAISPFVPEISEMRHYEATSVIGNGAA